MKKQEIINQINSRYNDFLNFIKELSEEDFEFRFQGKWSAKQQLEHIVMSIKPLVQVYSMNTSLIEQAFGKVDRKNKSYQVLVEEYLRKLKEGGKAPSQFVPEKETSSQRDSLTKLLKSLIESLTSKIDRFEEEELESLTVPHPLLGKITLKEMLYNAMYHVEHHKKQAIKYLKNR